MRRGWMPGRSAALRRAFLGATLLLALALVWSASVHAAGVGLPGVEITIGSETADRGELANAVKVLIGLTILSLAPAILVVMTAFTRIIIVLAMLRHAIGMQDTPPNTVLVSLALFLTVFTMLPVFNQVNEKAFAPYMDGRISYQKAFDRGLEPMRDFMIRQTREQDLGLMLDIAKASPPESVDEIKTLHLIPAFMLSELKTAFQIGFIIFLPFLLIDIVVSSILMSMGMLMVPPMMISLPLKVLMFVLIDGWNLVVRAVITSFH